MGQNGIVNWVEDRPDGLRKQFYGQDVLIYHGGETKKEELIGADYDYKAYHKSIGEFTVESKGDNYYWRTANMTIELFTHNLDIIKPSGISVTKADVWQFVFWKKRGIWLIKVDDLKPLVDKLKNKFGTIMGGEKTLTFPKGKNEMLLLPAKLILEHCIHLDYHEEAP